jgi:hypothetical protein
MRKQTDKTTMQTLLALGQSVWLDYLSRRMTRSGGLQALIDDGEYRHKFWSHFRTLRDRERSLG